MQKKRDNGNVQMTNSVERRVNNHVQSPRPSSRSTNNKRRRILECRGRKGGILVEKS